MPNLSNLINSLKGTSKPSEKQAVLLAHDSGLLRDLIVYTYHPFVLFNVSIKPSEIPPPGPMSLEDMENTIRSTIEFCEKSKSPKQNRDRAVEVLRLLNSGSQELLVGTLNKNWRCGLGVRNVLKAFNDIVPVFEVQLANTFDYHKKHKVDSWLVTPKLDGVRGIALRTDRWRMYTRKGHELLTVDHILDELERWYSRYGFTFFDGEVYKHGLEFGDIQGLATGFTRGTAYELEYHTFAYGSANSFLKQDASGVSILNELDGPSFSLVKPLKPITINNDLDNIKDTFDAAFSEGYEGIMLRPKNCVYDFKRSNQLMKLKSNNGDGETITDCVVSEVTIDKFPVIESGIMLEKDLVTAMSVLQSNGVHCDVGSGFDLRFRQYYKDHVDELIGKVVEVKHQGFGSKGKMRFPRLHRIREDL